MNAQIYVSPLGGQGVRTGGWKERPSVETDGLNDCLPYEKKVDENALRLSSNSFINILDKLY